MSAFSERFDWDAGLIWRIGVASRTATLDSMKAGAMHVCSALVDTGATQTCIARSVVDALGLQSIGKIDTNTAGGPAEVNIYDAHVILLPNRARNPGGSYDHRPTVFKDMQVLEFAPGSESRYQALIGRDILRIGVLTLSPDGHNSFAF